MPDFSEDDLSKVTDYFAKSSNPKDQPAQPPDYDAELTDHPRYQEWINECKMSAEIGRRHNDPKITPPPFPTWLRLKREEEAKPTPRLRGDNPPAWNVKRSSQLREQLSNLNHLETVCQVVCIGVAVFCAILAFATGLRPITFLILLGMVMVILIVLFRDKRKSMDAELAVLGQQITLDAYNTDFDAPLADRSTLHITAHFQVPNNLANSIPAPYGQSPLPSRFVEQLNRVTEAKLIDFTQRFTEPPARSKIEEYLNRELVQFQDENNVPIMRVNIPIAIHVHPDKPKGVHV